LAPARYLLWMVLTGLSLAQVSSEFVTADIRRAGSRLACLCGSCKNSVGDCAMLGCHYSLPARQKIASLQAQGATDDAIIDSFVREKGKVALVVPPVEGFFGLAWWMPVVVMGLGLALVYWFIQRMSKPAPVAPVEQRVLDRYKESIEKDLASLEE